MNENEEVEKEDPFNTTIFPEQFFDLDGDINIEDRRY
jgi:hypothetical protein